MSTVLYANDQVSDVYPKEVAIEIREGDWKGYLQHIIGRQGNNNFVSCYGDISAYKRQCAMAYLGKRAQFNGGGCSRTQPRILTQKMISDLEAKNKAQRYQRYPWLETLINLLAEIERNQDNISGCDVISLMSAAR
ncbi:MAG: hypothetical protein HHJ09_08470 [Glaciimonas sp.]|nr:hypothetical protein [Glaciimonas sp.]